MNNIDGKIKMKTYVISDTHFGHANIIKYCNRPFSNVHEHDETLIENWNSTVGPNDQIIHLGDVSFRNLNVLKRLNGIIHIVKGNHDDEKNLKWAFRNEYCTYSKSGNHEIKHKGETVVLSHFPYLRWNKCFHGSYHLFGHEHGNVDKVFGRSMDVSVDCIGFKPILLDDAIDMLKSRTNDRFYDNIVL